MALLIELAIEFGKNREIADNAVLHFQDHSFKFSDGLESILKTYRIEDYEGNSWLCIYPSGLSKSGVCSESDAKQMSEVGNYLYELLKSAPDFRFAIVGVEVELFRLESEIKEIDDVDYDGVVLSSKIWEMVGRPDNFILFREGYYWRPYKGETYDKFDF